MAELGKVLDNESRDVAPEGVIVEATLSTCVPAASQDTSKPKDACEAAAPVHSVTLLRGEKVSLDNLVSVVGQKASSQADLPHVIDTIMEELDASESTALLSQAKIHPRLLDFLQDMMGDDEFSLEDFGSADETAKDELVNLIQWLADRFDDVDEPKEPREPDDISNAVPAADDGPREGQPWFFLRSFARVSKLHSLHWG